MRTLIALLLLPLAALANTTEHAAGDESARLYQSIQQRQELRASPAAAVPGQAYLSAAQQAAQTATTRGTWTEVGPYNYFTDNPTYADPNFSNAGSGAGYDSGRITALAVKRDGQTVFAGGADGGLWRSTDAGVHWTPIGDALITTSIGTLALDETGGGCTVYAGTGEANTNADSYAGVGVLKSTDCGNSWARITPDSLVGALIWRIAIDGTDHNRLFLATSHGLWRSTDAGASWAQVLAPSTAFVGNQVTDVAVRPGTGGTTATVLAVIGWRNGYSTNGLYLSTDGGSHFSGPLNPQGYVPTASQGRVSLAWSADGAALYAVVQDPALFNVPGANTGLAGIYASPNGEPAGPYNQIATSSKLANANSAMAIPYMGRQYQPGIQAWYNQFVAVDPANSQHVYVGLEEVYETTDGGTHWETVGPYWDLTLPCFSYSPLGGSCKDTTHSDQHAAAIAAGSVWVGNDGGIWSRALTDHLQGGWNNLNQTLGTLQFYSAATGQAPKGPLTFYGGLQDNGTAKVVPGTLAAEPFGGDGGEVIVDPTNPDNVMTEYVDLSPAVSNDGGRSWRDVTPADPNPRFIAPFTMDAANHNHFVAGGEYVWEAFTGFALVASDWKITFDTGSGHSITSLATQAGTTYAGYCGPCNPSMSTGSGAPFVSGMATNVGGDWHSIASPVARIPTGFAIDPANPAHVYASVGGYSRQWLATPVDPGVGHVFVSSNGGASWTDLSGNLPDAPAFDLVLAGGKLVVATDVGVYSAPTGGGTWSRVGTNLPNVSVNDLSLTPDGKTLVAATHGRGLWTIGVGSL